MRYALCFLSGLCVAALLGLGAPAESRALALNHVGITVSDFDKSLAFYTKTLGFREAFVVRDDRQQPALAYLQVSRNSFVELFPASANRKPGLVHLALEVSDVREFTEHLKKAGVPIEDPRLGRTKALLTFLTDPDGNRIELLELGPESMQKKAVDAWKQP